LRVLDAIYQANFCGPTFVDIKILVIFKNGSASDNVESYRRCERGVLDIDVQSGEHLV
jgi:hypothetical protein